MAIHTVDDGALNSPAAKDYFTTIDRRYLIGMRATLDFLGLPVPIWAHRKMTGPSPAQAALRAYQADNRHKTHNQ